MKKKKFYPSKTSKVIKTKVKEKPFEEDEANHIIVSTIEHFGIESQLIKLVEEMAEATKEICKFALVEKELGNDLKEEIIDVSIVLSQIMMALEIYDASHPIYQKKLRRLRDKLKDLGVIL